MRRGKQFIYGAVYVLIWLGIFVGLYFLFFNKAPQPVAGCGSRCLPTSTQPVAVLGSVNMFPSAPGSATFLARVANPNVDAAAKTFAYAFNLYDASGALVRSIPAQSFLYAGEVKYLLAPNQPVASSVQSAALSVGSTTWVNPSVTGDVPKLSQQNVTTSATSDGIAVTGEIVDQDVSSFKDVQIIAVFEDASGVPLGASQTELNSIDPNQLEDFSVSYPALANADPSRTQVLVYAARPNL